jgi:hypothetical protein
MRSPRPWRLTTRAWRKVVASGRARWKIENGNNNTLKTKGYRFEHNLGHGQQLLSSWLTTLDLMDDKFGLLRQKLPSRKRWLNDMKALRHR